METKDLMIGDLVLYTEFGKNEFHRIEIVEPTRVWLNGCKTYVPDEYIEPIPLTPEILEKNGFKYDEERTKDMRDLNSYSTIFFNFPLGEGFHIEWNTQNNVGVITDHCFVKFRYVHEFQHVLRLCNINKEIII